MALFANVKFLTKAKTFVALPDKSIKAVARQDDSYPDFFTLGLAQAMKPAVVKCKKDFPPNRRRMIPEFNVSLGQCKESD